MASDKLCPICSSTRDFLYPWQGFQVLRCGGCETESVTPEPAAAELAAYYQDFNAAYMDRWPGRLKLVQRGFEHHLREYRRFAGRRKPQGFLDLGGGVGYWVRAALDRGIEACLMDGAADALRFARDTLGIPWVVEGDIQHCADYAAAESFDFIFARHVIEHLVRPDEFIRNAASLLREGGLLEIETPNVLSKEQFAHPGVIKANYHILRQGYPAISAVRAAGYALAKSMSGVNPPKHLWGFTQKGLGMLLERNGFMVLMTRQAIAGHWAFDPLYYEMQLSSSRKRPSVPYSLWERVVSLLFAGRGTNLCILARRSA